MSSIQVPADFICPITAAIMERPVMDREGNSYEELAIQQWLAQGNSTSPITRNHLVATDLVTNRALKSSIEQFLAQNRGRELSVTAARQPPQTAGSRGAARAGGGAAPTSTTGGANAAAPPPPAMTPQQQQAPPEVKLMHDDDGRYLLTIQPPAAPTGTTTDSTNDRLPLDVICVIDISGSMTTKATVQNEKNEIESHGLTVFNVVEHATKTVTKLLGPNDRFALVTFNQVAQTVMPLTMMDATGQQTVEDKLASMEPDGRTNLWGGLQAAMDLIKDAAANSPPHYSPDRFVRPQATSQQRTTSIMLLTDGCPNVEPPRGHMPTLKNYLAKLSPRVAPFTVNTFGFGFDLDSTLLNEIATETGGMYVFIPDSGLVGTVFLNTMANLLVTMTPQVKVAIEAPAPIKHAIQLSPTAFGGQGSIGPLQYGQPRETYFRLSNADKGLGLGSPGGRAQKVSAKVDMILNNAKVSVTVESQPAPPTVAPQLKVHGARCQFCSVIASSSPELANQRNLAHLASALSNVQGTNGCNVPLIAGLLKDVRGEVTMAYSTHALYAKWGRHYLPSLVRANTLQQCNNFKDHSVQLYGGSLFLGVRDAGESTFLTLPPPEPKARGSLNGTPGLSSSSSNGILAAAGGVRGAWRSTTTTPAAAPIGGAVRSAPMVDPVVVVADPDPDPVDMTPYYYSGGGCISADSLVALADGATKRACEVERGDVLSSGSVVDCRVEIQTNPTELLLVHFQGGLTVSPYHPIRHRGTKDWVFPIDSTEAGKVVAQAPLVDTIYSFLLQTQRAADGGPVDAPWLSVNGIDVVAMAHGLSDSAGVVSHPYFATDAIRRDLEALPGHADKGVVRVAGWRRDTRDQKVNGII